VLAAPGVLYWDTSHRMQIICRRGFHDQHNKNLSPQSNFALDRVRASELDDESGKTVLGARRRAMARIDVLIPGGGTAESRCWCIRVLLCAFWERLCCSLGAANSPVIAAANNRRQQQIKHGMSGMMHAPKCHSRPPAV
jgi:hypothetical protein